MRRVRLNNFLINKITGNQKNFLNKRNKIAFRILHLATRSKNATYRRLFQRPSANKPENSINPTENINARLITQRVMNQYFPYSGKNRYRTHTPDRIIIPLQNNHFVLLHDFRENMIRSMKRSSSDLQSIPSQFITIFQVITGKNRNGRTIPQTRQRLLIQFGIVQFVNVV